MNWKDTIKKQFTAINDNGQLLHQTEILDDLIQQYIKLVQDSEYLKKEPTGIGRGNVLRAQKAAKEIVEALKGVDLLLLIDEVKDDIRNEDSMYWRDR